MHSEDLNGLGEVGRSLPALAGWPSVASARALAARAVSSSVAPSGMSTITCNSLLLSNGSILTLTNWK